MKRVVLAILCLTSGFFIIACVARQTGDNRLEEIARYRTGMAYGLAIHEGYAYITTNRELIITDISNPRKPQRVGRLKLGTPSFAVKIAGRKAYLAATDRGLVVVDVSDPRDPTILGECHDGGEVRRMDVIDSYCITSSFENGLNILDISNTSKPVKIGNLGYRRIRQFASAGNLVYFVDIDKGLRVADISDRTAPVEVTSVDETEGASSVSIHSNRLFLSFFDGSIKIFDISDPESPHLITSIKCPGEVSGLVAADNYLLINVEGVLIKDISDLNAIVDIGHHRRKEGAHGIAYQDGYVYFVKNGLTILKINK